MMHLNNMQEGGRFQLNITSSAMRFFLIKCELEGEKGSNLKALENLVLSSVDSPL